jgi:hypothetical protein
MQNVFVQYNNNEQKKKLLHANTLCYLHINELFGRKLMKSAYFIMPFIVSHKHSIFQHYLLWN